ncbi:unnamed protein product [Amoebophrya sp. A120]|nr:unnamed protein product [Amoebophrya sp. A120]|eukprot:GSA120T00006529001.1
MLYACMREKRFLRGLSDEVLEVKHQVQLAYGQWEERELRNLQCGDFCRMVLARRLGVPAACVALLPEDEDTQDEEEDDSASGGVCESQVVSDELPSTAAAPRERQGDHGRGAQEQTQRGQDSSWDEHGESLAATAFDFGPPEPFLPYSARLFPAADSRTSGVPSTPRTTTRFLRARCHRVVVNTASWRLTCNRKVPSERTPTVGKGAVVPDFGNRRLYVQSVPLGSGEQHRQRVRDFKRRRSFRPGPIRF